ncbi:AI-2E family transporter [Nocardioides albidus]|uniref:AI-2E family transporter n=1 Tax=Nocardioides albidus TaxID=1517589 RepID=A0A5C4VN64_9ACTN|nr:AI-2E family transporter [Nocardioides albidus]TNM37334.1 AI-2E family transporter [Nocardioides albidus]
MSEGPAETPAEESAETPAEEAASRAAQDHAVREAEEDEPPLGPDEGEREERLFRRFAHQWALARERERRQGPLSFATGPSNLRRAEVPYGLDLAAGWAWRLLLIAGAGYVLIWLVGYFAVVTIPLAVALLISALAAPFVSLISRSGVPRGLSALLVVVFGFAIVGSLLSFAGQQVAAGAHDLADSTVQGLQEIRDWLQDGPLNASDSQINDYIKSAQDLISERSKDGGVLSQVSEVGTAVGHVVAGFFIALFATYFFLADGARIWAWVVRLAPRVARARMDSSGRVAWLSLVQFVRATVVVALVDATGIAIGAAVLNVPFVLAIGVLVFLGSFVPMIGATIAGSVAILVALVDQGPVTALLMLAVVVGVQQLEGHVLQPFLLGRWVSLHPLGVILAIACGVLVAGIAGALVAVPLAAAANAVVLHLAEMAEPPASEEETGGPEEERQPA